MFAATGMFFSKFGQLLTILSQASVKFAKIQFVKFWAMLASNLMAQDFIQQINANEPFS
jgi:hypothetical protein